jgi:DNA (cytosine-5)-methyltransferase 1
MNHGSLFSGIGGFDLAAEWMGWNNKFHCDINPFSRKLCSFYWPEAESYDNIKTTDFRIWRGKIDILSGGFPCQPFSVAGKRMGKEDDRHLWPQMFRAIREIRPRYVVGENVRGFLNWSEGLVLEEVYADLESEGYEVQTFVLPAVGINAPHRRDRVYIIAHANSDARRSGSSEGGRTECEADSNGESSIYLGSQSNGNEGNVANTEQLRLEHSSKTRNIFGSVSEAQGQECKSPDEFKTNDNVHPQQGGPSETWDGFPIKSPLCSGDYGLPIELDGLTFPKWRKESIMGYGNAIVPQIAYRIFATIDEIESQKS